MSIPTTAQTQILRGIYLGKLVGAGSLDPGLNHHLTTIVTRTSNRVIYQVLLMFGVAGHLGGYWRVTLVRRTESRIQG